MSANGEVKGEAQPQENPTETVDIPLNHMTVPTPMEDDPYKDKTIFDFQVLNCYRELYDLKQHKGHVILIVNVASASKEYTESCYRLLTTLYKKYSMEGLDILAFPCNQFGAAEPGSEDEIAENLSSQFPSLGDIEFPIMAKVEVNGDHELPLYSFLKSRIKGTLGQTSIKWNFTYFIVDREGIPVYRFSPETPLEEIELPLVELLQGKMIDAKKVESPEEPEPGSPLLADGTRPPSSEQIG